MSVKIAIGLGNMGSKYDGTRHNVGMDFVARLGKSYGASFVKNKYCAAYLAQANVLGKPVIFAAMEGFMNESGINLGNVLRFCKASIADCLVFYDEIAIDSGKLKLSVGGSSGGHNGIENIMNVCGNSFVRFRIGLGAKPFKTMDLADYVLGKFAGEELSALDALFPEVKAAFELTVSKGIVEAQNKFNRTKKEDKKSPDTTENI